MKYTKHEIYSQEYWKERNDFMETSVYIEAIKREKQNLPKDKRYFFGLSEADFLKRRVMSYFQGIQCQFNETIYNKALKEI